MLVIPNINGLVAWTGSCSTCAGITFDVLYVLLSVFACKELRPPFAGNNIPPTKEL